MGSCLSRIRRHGVNDERTTIWYTGNTGEQTVHATNPDGSTDARYAEQARQTTSKSSRFGRFRNIFKRKPYKELEDNGEEMKEEKKLEAKELSLIAENIGQNWEILGSHLGINPATIDQIKMDHRSARMQIFYMLLIWQQQYGPDATLQTLLFAMKDAESVYINWNGIKDNIAMARDIGDVPREKTEEERTYETLRKQLEDDLIIFNRIQHRTISLSPLLEEKDTDLLDFYVVPEMNSTEVHKYGIHDNEIPKPVRSLEDIFDDSERGREIYLTADAGIGKTAFCKRLAVIWCYAHSPVDHNLEHFTNDDLNVMLSFRFLFLVSLKDSNNEYFIDDMIFQQVVSQLSHSSKYTKQNLQDILHQERCLVILDGLDEWSYQGLHHGNARVNVPRRNARECCTILTTTRPWKLNLVELKESQIDKKVELRHLSKKATRELKINAIAKIKRVRKDDAKVELEKFDSEIEDKGFKGLDKIPLFLLYLLCLWCKGEHLGRSKCELYANIVRLLLLLSEEKHRNIFPFELRPETLQVYKSDQEDMPKSYISQIYSEKFYPFLKSLGQLAFKTLFARSGEKTLVCDSVLLRIYIPEKYLNFALSSGILTQSKVYDELLRRESNVSFAHEMLHEFFAAVYMQSIKERDLVDKAAMSSCTSIQNVLELSNVFVFLSGMNPDTLKALSSLVMDILSQDATVLDYRCTAYYSDYNTTVLPLNDIQDMYIACMNENLKNNCGSLNILLQDVIIDSDCNNEKYLVVLKNLIKMNELNIKSVFIDLRQMPDLYTDLKCFGLDKLSKLDKLFFKGVWPESYTSRLLSGSCRSLKSFTIMSDDTDTPNTHNTWTYTLSNMLSRMCELQAIVLDCFSIRHIHIETLLRYLTGRTRMTEILLYRLNCSDDKTTCSGCELDLSRHEDMKVLALHDIPLSKLHLNVSSLTVCEVGQFSNAAIAKEYFRNLRKVSKIETFTCFDLGSSDCIKEMLQTLPYLHRVKDVRISGINLGEKDLPLSPLMSNIESVLLNNVKLSSSCFRDLVLKVQKYKQMVTVELNDCQVTPEVEYRNVMSDIATSDTFLLNSDERNALNKHKVSFDKLLSGD
ncbi:uncharacterized protein LOC128550043 [Mercenaria mercenaria]|uniref:uncharacterized protein LOC128550043 n=1 Tax=Mercenaria mercenaria TaxID=6596 RepID=UPI00234F415C|nr:uncharacterized protein LOC128550043 [Mercenaria mercenaria]